jgi:hypothetical protein
MELLNTNPEVVVWLPTLLDEPSRKELTDSLRRRTGIRAAEFCPIRHHLMRVQYQGDCMNSQEVLRCVRQISADAKLVGPI